MPSTDATSVDLAISTADGLRLRAKHWPVASPRGVVVIVHGFGEHGGSYEHVVQAIGPAAGVDFVAADLRGHGLSPGRRGVVRRYNDLTTDLIATLAWVGRERPGLPCFILGHSNGGQVALRAALNSEFGRQIAGLILSNPSLRLALQVPSYKLWLAQVLIRIAPWVTLDAGLETDKLTRDPAMRLSRDADLLCHSRMSAPLFFGMLEGGVQIAARAGEIHNPVLLILGGSDPIVDPRASREVFDRLGSTDKTLLLFPGMLHEPLNELGREQVYADLFAWLDNHLPTSPDIVIV